MEKRILSWIINEDNLTESIKFGDSIDYLIDEKVITYDKKDEKHIVTNQPNMSLIIKNKTVVGAIYPKSKNEEILGINTKNRGVWPIDIFIKEISLKFKRSPQWDNIFKYNDLEDAKGQTLMQVIFRDAYPSLIIKIRP